MKVYIPAKFLQLELHLRGNSPARLDNLINLLIALKFEPVIGINLLGITNTGLLMLPTRHKNFPFSSNEIEFIQKFIYQGNPLFHLSNHYPWTRHDTRLGQIFGYRFHNSVQGQIANQNFDVYPLPNSISIFSSINKNKHFTIRNSSIVSRDDETFYIISDFSRSELPSVNSSSAFGIAQPSNSHKGAIVALGDSGILGEPIDNYPGPGLNEGDNRTLVKHILMWLRNQTI